MPCGWAGFSPYKVFSNLHICFGLLLSSKPSGCGMYTVSVKSLFIMALFMSTCLKIQSLFTANVKIIMIVTTLTIGPNIVLKLRLGVCMNPFTQAYHYTCQWCYLDSSSLYIPTYFQLACNFECLVLRSRFHFSSKHCIHPSF